MGIQTVINAGNFVSDDDMMHYTNAFLVMVNTLIAFFIIKSTKINDTFKVFNSYTTLLGDVVRTPRLTNALFLLINIATSVLFMQVNYYVSVTIIGARSYNIYATSTTFILSTLVTSIFVSRSSYQWNTNSTIPLVITTVSQSLIYLVYAVSDINVTPYTVEASWSGSILKLIIIASVEILAVNVVATLIFHYCQNPTLFIKKIVPRPIPTTHVLRHPLVISTLFGFIISLLYFLPATHSSAVTDPAVSVFTSITQHLLIGICIVQLSLLRLFLQLNQENYYWNWYAWLTGCSSGIFVALINAILLTLNSTRTFHAFIPAFFHLINPPTFTTLNALVIVPVIVSSISGAISYLSCQCYIRAMLVFNRSITVATQAQPLDHVHTN